MSKIKGKVKLISFIEVTVKELSVVDPTPSGSLKYLSQLNRNRWVEYASLSTLQKKELLLHLKNQINEELKELDV